MNPENLEEIIHTAMAGMYMGHKLIYLEAGSGADQSVPNQMIRSVVASVRIPVIVGGGIRDPQSAREKVDAGASFVVTGTIMEEQTNHLMLESFARAIHGA